MYKLCSSNSCPAKTFCCLCCCSCCVPNTSSTRCFIWYCCCLGWKQTDPYKVFKAISKFVYKIFYYGLLCCVWKRLYKLTKERKANKKKEAEEKRKQRRLEDLKERKNRLEKDMLDDLEDEGGSDLDQEDDVDFDDFNIETQSFNRGQCPFPSTPFSKLGFIFGQNSLKMSEFSDYVTCRVHIIINFQKKI